MWKVLTAKTGDGFVLSESIISLVILCMAVTLLFTCYQGINLQRQRLASELTAARLAKEASDRLVESKMMVIMKRHNYRAIAQGKSIKVYQGNRLVLRIE